MSSTPGYVKVEAIRPGYDRGKLERYLFQNERTRKTSTGTARLVSPDTIIGWKVTVILPYGPWDSKRYGLDCKVVMTGMPLDFVRQRALDEAKRRISK